MMRVASVLGVAALLAACGGEPEPDAAGEGRPAASDTVPVSSEAVPGAGGESASAGPADRDDRPVHRRLLRIVNPGEDDVVVYASAGAGRVGLDTVAAGDSAEVNVESRAPRVGLHAMAGGRRVGSDSLDLTAAGTARWRVSGGP